MIHVAILQKPYLDAIFTGRKSVELRLTITKRVPFNAIKIGERIYFKQSSGPFRNTAIVKNVLFADQLTPQKLMKLKRRYNAEILGSDAYWNSKQNAKYATLIWLHKVERITFGPSMKPSQGLAWFAFDESKDVYPQCLEQRNSSLFSVAIPLTSGSLRNGYVNIRIARDAFPPDVQGGSTLKTAGQPLRLDLANGPTLITDIVTKRNIFRTRKWKPWFLSQNAMPGDTLFFEAVDTHHFRVSLQPAGNHI